MKILHCADLHLDSSMETNLDRETAKLRKGEILNTFIKMVDYAADNAISIILIAGDLFDKNRISATASNTVKNAITSHPGITFYYLKGNHDSESLFKDSESNPINLKLFSENWTSYIEAGGKIRITGAELNSTDNSGLYNSLLLDNSCFNIVMLHGQENTGSGKSKDKSETINIRALKNKAIDYLALGHIHFQKTERLDARGTYCYPGCLEGRGFDECGEHGFMTLDIDLETLKYTLQFIPFASRHLFTINTDISGCETSQDIIFKIENDILAQGCRERDLLKIVLKGSAGLECEKDSGYITSVFKDRFFFVKLYDETTPFIDARDYILDSSLKGEFVRTVLNDPEISEADKPFVIKIGLDAILGEKYK